MAIIVVLPNAQEMDAERYLRKPAYLKSNTIEVDFDDLYNRYEIYKYEIKTNPIDSDYEPISFSKFAEYYITKRGEK
jgi:hypothetical protein